MTTDEPDGPGETVAELAKRVGRAPVTVWRWIRTGVVVNGRRVHLAARRVGGTWSVSRAAWEQFDRECNPGAGPVPESPAKAARRLAAGKRAAAKLLG